MVARNTGLNIGTDSGNSPYANPDGTHVACQIQQKSRTWSGLKTLVRSALRFILLSWPKLTSLECSRIVSVAVKGSLGFGTS